VRFAVSTHSCVCYHHNCSDIVLVRLLAHPSFDIPLEVGNDSDCACGCLKHEFAFSLLCSASFLSLQNEGDRFEAVVRRHACSLPNAKPYQDPYVCPGYNSIQGINSCNSQSVGDPNPIEARLLCTVDSNGKCEAEFLWNIYIPEGEFEGACEWLASGLYIGISVATQTLLQLAVLLLRTVSCSLCRSQCTTIHPHRFVQAKPCWISQWSSSLKAAQAHSCAPT
jgi:hypothetical protein